MKIMTLLVVLLSSASVVWASGSHKGGHQKEGAHWTAPMAAIHEVNPVASDSNSKLEGMKLFTELCARCHGNQALGDGPEGQELSVKPTNLKQMAGGHPDGDFAWKIINGRGEMPGWEDDLKAEEVWHLVNYIQSLKNNSPAKLPTHEHGHD